MMAQTPSATRIGSMPRCGPGGFARGLPAGAASAASARARAAAARAARAGRFQFR